MNATTRVIHRDGIGQVLYVIDGDNAYPFALMEDDSAQVRELVDDVLADDHYTNFSAVPYVDIANAAWRTVEQYLAQLEAEESLIHE